ncbi:endonuclease/exonuclease/phosphatase family metal-dependent hydrolase [Kibdelosporangium banguiense]|uniref:Endonuclease/exonuclease/phosphatase family metal-dependent hydrolase n=1 Tax=Kibdelosporangium banguiense TaxID=1365924 RepID=A0ABS4TV11_9PSEU|nr:endonuclease/exonuclease/phosphatase family metal-dependent hydrolase [Kibdelosporangium banguiense]
MARGRNPFACTDRPTYRAEYLPAGRPANRIDYLLVSGHPVTSADLILAEPAHGGIGFLSDHLALWIPSSRWGS